MEDADSLRSINRAKKPTKVDSLRDSGQTSNLKVGSILRLSWRPVVVVQDAHNTLPSYRFRVLVYLWDICIISSQLRIWLTNSEGLHCCLI